MSNIKNNIKWILLAVVVMAVCFLGGRMTAPTKTETVTEIRWKEKVTETERENTKETETTKEDKDKMYVKIVKELPDGSKETEVRVVDRGTVEVGKVAETDKEKTTEKETLAVEKVQKVTEKEKDSWQISLIGVAQFPNVSKFNNEQFVDTGYDLGIHVQRRIIGDCFIGAYGDSGKTLGISMGLSL